jgi:hypothetical protein
MSSHILIAVRGVNSEGLRMMVFPVARAGPIFHATIKTRRVVQMEELSSCSRITYEGSSLEIIQREFEKPEETREVKTYMG